MMNQHRSWLSGHNILKLADVPVSVFEFWLFFYKSQKNLIAKSIENFAATLSDIFGEHNIIFKYKQSITFLEGETHSDGVIVIYICNDFLELYKSRSYKFDHILFDVLKHELVHREQFNKIDFGKYDGIGIPEKLPEPQKNKKYLSHKTEMMSFARVIPGQLIKQFKTNHKLLQFLRNPVPYNSDLLDSYIVNFKDDKKTLDQLYKYMYQYIINDFDKKEMK